MHLVKTLLNLSNNPTSLPKSDNSESIRCFVAVALVYICLWSYILNYKFEVVDAEEPKLRLLDQAAGDR